MKQVLPANPDEEVFTSFGTRPSTTHTVEFKHPNCSDDPLEYAEMSCQSGNPVQHEMVEVQSFVKEKLQDAITSAVTKSKAAQRAEDKRIADMVLELGRAGKYILNERPEGMSFEDFKIVRARLNKFKQNHIHAGTLIHKSAETEIRTGRNGRKIIAQKSKGMTYRKPFELDEEFEKKISAQQPDPLTQQLSK